MSRTGEAVDIRAAAAADHDAVAALNRTAFGGEDEVGEELVGARRGSGRLRGCGRGAGEAPGEVRREAVRMGAGEDDQPILEVSPMALIAHLAAQLNALQDRLDAAGL